LISEATRVVSSLPIIISGGLAVWWARLLDLSMRKQQIMRHRKLTAWKELLLEPFGVAFDGLGPANTVSTWDLVGRVGPDILRLIVSTHCTIRSLKGGRKMEARHTST
jgi:hypothetical protein